MSLMSQPLTITHFPWHSYDFDFTSLNLTLPHLVDPQGTVVFWRTDFVYADPPQVAELGELSLRFEKRERRARAQHAALCARRRWIAGINRQLVE